MHGDNNEKLHEKQKRNKDGKNALTKVSIGSFSVQQKIFKFFFSVLARSVIHNFNENQHYKIAFNKT